jgi:hypothetical protein
MIVYPLTRALYGKRIRQPIGGDFGFSGRLAAFYLTKDVWDTDVARYGIDVWMTTSAIVNDFKICQSFLGSKIHDPKDPGADLSAMLYQVINTVFSLMEEYPHECTLLRKTEPVPTFGFKYVVSPKPLQVNLECMISGFMQGAKEFLSLYEQLFSKKITRFIEKVAKRPMKRFVLPDDIWTEIIYDIAISCRKGFVNRQNIINTLVPLYLGKVASFVAETVGSSPDEVEGRLEGLCLAFEEGKSYLHKKWFEECAGEIQPAPERTHDISMSIMPKPA